MRDSKGPRIGPRGDLRLTVMPGYLRRAPTTCSRDKDRAVGRVRHTLDRWDWRQR